ncbi:MAG TPA: serine/threonine-protein kinase [Planctomycetota bacterium]|nr:serine/threonine-protein kinase [Planctomycetota bacterium]
MASASGSHFEYQEPLLEGGRGILVPRSRSLAQAQQMLQRGGFLTVSAPPRSGVTTFLFALRKVLGDAVYIDLANLAFLEDPPREAARVLARELRTRCPGAKIPEQPASVGDVLDVLARQAAEGVLKRAISGENRRGAVTAPSAVGSDAAQERRVGVSPASAVGNDAANTATEQQNGGAGRPHDGKIIIVIDGFDAWNDEAARRLVLAFRAAYTEARTFGAAGANAFAIITGSSVDLRDLTATGRTSPLNIAQFIFLPDFDAAEVRSMLSAGLGACEPAKLERLAHITLDWTGGHPALTQMVGHYLAENNAANATDDNALWQNVITHAREATTQLLGATLGLLPERPELRRTATEIYSGGNIPCDRIHRPIRELVHLGLIKADESGTARPRNRLFEQALAPALNLKSAHTSVSLWNATTGHLPVAPAKTDVSGELKPESGAISVSVHASTIGPIPKDQVIRREVPIIDSDSGIADSTGDPVQKSLKGREQRPQIVPEGTVVGGCRIGKRIGKGGMAEVYLARQLALDIDVAMKVLRQLPETGKRIAQRFLREARAAAQLSHENIVQIRNVGRENDYQFIEMEYLPGGSLGDLVDQGPFRDVPTAIRMLREAAAGVQAAHRKGIIHRDIKPDNLMLTATRRVKVVDFGLAAIASGHPLADGSSSRLTEDGVILGTPHYMAPEQWEGKDVDERTDVYSLGATFYHLLSGRTPFDGRTAVELINNFSNRSPALLVRFNPDLPVSLCHAISKMLEKDPTRRYANIEALLKDPQGLAHAAVS